jgi:hypothetical protein
VATLPSVSTTPVVTVAKFVTNVVDTGSNLPPVLLTPVANLPVASTPVVPVAKFAAGVVDTGGAP